MDEYCDYYFTFHPRAKKKPIERPIHPSINVWCIMPRFKMNAEKQKWHDFGCWWIKKLGLQDMKLEKFNMTYTVYMPTRRRADPDNISPKFLQDSFVDSGFIVDDDGKHLLALTLKTDYDKNNPRTEIDIEILE